MFNDDYLFLVNKVEEIERRFRRMIFYGVVTDVDHSRGLVRVDDGMGTEEGALNKTDWLPWAEHAGKIKTRTMPSVGQQVTVLCPSGVPEQGIVTIGWFNENNKMPKAESGEYVFINGTHYKRVVENGPGTSAGGDDGSDSTCGGQACPAKSEAKSSVGTGIERTRFGKLPDDEGSWGDGQNQVKPQGDDKAVTERGVNQTKLIHYVTDGTTKSVIVQTAADVTSTVNDGSVRKQTASDVTDKVGGSVATIDSGKIRATASRVETEGATYLVNPDATKKVVLEGLKDALKLYAEPLEKSDEKVVEMDTAIEHAQATADAAAAAAGGDGGSA
jgi:hypothetical protein